MGSKKSTLRGIKKIKERITAKDKEMGLVYDLATKELQKRKTELLRELLAKAIIIENGSGKYEIKLPKNLGFAKLIVVNDLLILENLHVGPYNVESSALRNLGIGRLLVNIIKDFAIKKGLKMIRLWSLRNTTDFYKKLGFLRDKQTKYFYIKL